MGKGWKGKEGEIVSQKRTGRKEAKKRSPSSITDRVNFSDMTMNSKAEKTKHTQLSLIRPLQKSVDLLMTAT